MRTGIIYKYTHRVSGKAYIGYTVNPEERKEKHLWCARTPHNVSYNSHFHNALRKYGEDAFEYTVLCICPLWYLPRLEVLTIAAFDTYKNGYNMTEGGDGCGSANKGRKHTKEAKANMSAAHKGKKLTEEHRANMSAAQKGKKFTEEHRANMSKCRQGEFPYACLRKSGRWRAKVLRDGKTHYIGTFDTQEEASAAGVAARAQLVLESRGK